MTNIEFKVGDKVTILPDLKSGKLKDGFYINSSMLKHRGKTFTITDKDDSKYRLDVKDTSRWTWTKECFVRSQEDLNKEMECISTLCKTMLTTRYIIAKGPKCPRCTKTYKAVAKGLTKHFAKRGEQKAKQCINIHDTITDAARINSNKLNLTAMSM